MSGETGTYIQHTIDGTLVSEEEYKAHMEFKLIQTAEARTDEEYLAFDLFEYEREFFKEFGKKKIVKTRKDHSCSSPVSKRHTISTGTRVLYECRLHESDVWQYHWTCFGCIDEAMYSDERIKERIKNADLKNCIPVSTAFTSIKGKLSKMRPDLDHTNFARAQVANSIETFDEYDVAVLPLAVYPNQGNNIVYPALGLAGEAGEVADKIKKVIRDKNGVLDESDRVAILKEVGDVMWYCAALASELKSTSKQCAQMNVKKLLDRNAKGTLQGEGDDR